MNLDFHRLDLNLLRVLEALDRLRSVTAAGQALSLSQPAASNALARLRRHFGDALFVRTAGTLVPTPTGQRLAAAAARHLQALERELAAPAPFDPASSTHTWRLSLSDLGEMVFLPAIAATVLAAAPHTHLVNAAVPAQAVGEALARHEIDIAIGILDARRRGLRHERLFSETYVALGSAALPPRQRRRETLARLGFVLASPTATFHGGVEAVLRRAGLGERIAVRARHFAAMPDLVLSGPLIGVVPQSWARQMCADRPGLAWWPLPVLLPDYDVNLLWHETTEGDPALDWLRTTLVTRLRRG